MNHQVCVTIEHRIELNAEAQHSIQEAVRIVGARLFKHDGPEIFEEDFLFTARDMSQGNAVMIGVVVRFDLGRYSSYGLGDKSENLVTAITNNLAPHVTQHVSVAVIITTHQQAKSTGLVTPARARTC